MEKSTKRVKRLNNLFGSSQKQEILSGDGECEGRGNGDEQIIYTKKRRGKKEKTTSGKEMGISEFGLKK